MLMFFCGDVFSGCDMGSETGYVWLRTTEAAAAFSLSQPIGTLIVNHMTLCGCSPAAPVFSLFKVTCLNTVTQRE